MMPPPAAKAARCPQCGKPAMEEARPFCSERCRTLDLHKWLNESYAIPAQETPDEDDSGRQD
jgi:uncharacterized protein